MVLALPKRPPAPDENETPEQREQRRAREKRELLEWLQGRLARFAVGDWLALLAEARAAWPVQRRGAEQGEQDDEEREEARRMAVANRVCEAARDGRIARARQQLCSTGLLPGTDATRRAIEKLLRPVGKDPPSKEWIERGRAHAMGLDPKDLAKRIRELGKGGAACMAGWYAEHMQLMLADKRDFAVLHAYLDSVTRCRMSDGFYDSMALGRLVPARKGLKNKVRPLVVPDTQRKVCETTVCENRKAKFLSCLAPEQYAVGMTAAIEKLAKSAHCIIEAVDDLAVAQLDANSAYNNMEREPVLEEVEADCVEVLSFLATFMCRTGRYVFYDDNGHVHVIETPSLGRFRSAPLPLGYGKRMRELAPDLLHFQ